MIVFIWGDVYIDVDKYTHTHKLLSIYINIYVNINSFCEFCMFSTKIIIIYYFFIIIRLPGILLLLFIEKIFHSEFIKVCMVLCIFNI